MNEQERKAFGEEIRMMRKAKHWTQQQLADAAGVSKGSVGNLERGKVETQAGNLGKVLDALGYKRDQPMWSPEVDAFLQMVGFRLAALSEAEQDELIFKITRYAIGRTDQ